MTEYSVLLVNFWGEKNFKPHPQNRTLAPLRVFSKFPTSIPVLFTWEFTLEKEENHKLPFLDVLLDNHSNQGIITSVFHKKTYTGLLTNYYSFVPFSYKLGLVRTLVDRVFKINNTWTGFHLDISSLTKTLRKNLFPSTVIENVVRKFLNNYFTSDSSQSVARKDNCLYVF